jgi:hypothetical protein
MENIRDIKTRKVTKEEYKIAAENGIPARTVRYRLQKGYSKQLAITYPSYKRLPIKL